MLSLHGKLPSSFFKGSVCRKTRSPSGPKFLNQIVTAYAGLKNNLMLE